MQWFREKTLVVPFDFCDLSVDAVELALQLAPDPSAVHILHVIPPLVVTEPGVIWGTIDDRSRITHAREAMAKRLHAVGADACVVDVRIGDAGTEVCSYAEDVGAGLIIVGSHGRTGLSRFFLGSVAERVTRYAPCPVLVVKPEVQAEREAKLATSEATEV